MKKLILIILIVVLVIVFGSIPLSIIGKFFWGLSWLFEKLAKLLNLFGWNGMLK